MMRFGQAVPIHIPSKWNHVKTKIEFSISNTTSFKNTSIENTFPTSFIINDFLIFPTAVRRSCRMCCASCRWLRNFKTDCCNFYIAKKEKKIKLCRECRKFVFMVEQIFIWYQMAILSFMWEGFAVHWVRLDVLWQLDALKKHADKFYEIDCSHHCYLDAKIKSHISEA